MKRGESDRMLSRSCHKPPRRKKVGSGGGARRELLIKSCYNRSQVTSVDKIISHGAQVKGAASALRGNPGARGGNSFSASSELPAGHKQPRGV